MSAFFSKPGKYESFFALTEIRISHGQWVNKRLIVHIQNVYNYGFHFSVEFVQALEMD
jgi:hypothetical protein